MALFHNVRVDIPGKTYIRKQNDCRYVYLYTDHYRTEHKKVRHTAVMIGKIDDETGKLIPNGKYFEFFGEGTDNQFQAGDGGCYDGAFSVGYTAVFARLFEDLGLAPILKRHFGAKADDIMALAGYIIREGSVMSYIDDFLMKNLLVGIQSSLTSQRVSDLFYALEFSGTSGFFTDWVKKCMENDYIAYDVSSISTYSEGITEAEYGYNRDHEDLAQLNLGLFTATKSRLPVFYDSYNGSLTDKVNLRHVLENAGDVGITDVKLVMDGGFFDEKRIQYLVGSGHTFTVGMPSSLDASKKLLDEHRGEIHAFTNRTSFDGNYARCYDYEIFGVKGRVAIGLCTATQELMAASLKADIEKRTDELNAGKVKKYSTVMGKKRYTDLFDIRPNAQGDGFTFQPDEEKLGRIARNYGYFLIFTTDMGLTADELLYYYRAKDLDEKMFCQLKVYMDFNRPRTQTAKTTDGKFFCMFIALILRSALYQKLERYKTAHHLTLERCIRKLEDIMIIRKGSRAHLAKALTKTQKEILSLFNVDINEVVAGFNQQG